MSFLEEVIQDLAEKCNQTTDKFSIFFPSNNALTTFQLLIKNWPPTIQPILYTLEEWIISQSQLQPATTLELVTILYKVFQTHHPKKESFEQFYGWGIALLQDFDTLDRYLVNPAILFTNVYQQKVLDPTYDYLTDSQKEVIKTFWKNFSTKLSTQQQDFLEMAALFPIVYKDFTEQLQAQGKAYTGLCYKKMARSLKEKCYFPPTPTALVGFNELQPAGEKIVMEWQKHVSTLFYWDLDAYYMRDEIQEAGYYLRAHQQKPLFKSSFQQPYPNRIKEKPKIIQYRAFSSAIGQVKQAICTLEAWLKTNTMSPAQIVIALADEDLLIPLVTSWSDKIPPFSTSLGYPLAQTNSYHFIKKVLNLYITQQQPTCPLGYWPTQPIIDLLQHPFIYRSSPLIAKEVLKKIHHLSARYIPQSLLPCQDKFYQTLWDPPKGAAVKDYVLHLDNLLALVRPYCSHPSFFLSEETIVTHLKEQLQHLHRSLITLEPSPLQSLLKILVQLLKDVTIPFDKSYEGAAIAIMRIHETALMDFDYVLMIGMNEGSFPSTAAQHSLIPYNLRKGYDLPTLDTCQASLNAYHFYRLLQRSKVVHMTYTLPNTTNNYKEMSRYLWQLQYESGLPIHQEIINTPIVIDSPKPIIVEKDDAVMASLSQFIYSSDSINPPENGFTPTIIHTYVECSLRFYFHYILKLKNTTPSNGAIRFGNLLHAIMEKLYAPLLEKGSPYLQSADIIDLKKRIKNVIIQVFDHTYQQGNTTADKGPELIEQAVMEKLINQLLTLDAQQAPFTLLGLEVGKNKAFIVPLKLPNNQTVALKGIIDRLDIQNDIIRVIDYKTGRDTNYIASIEALFENKKGKNRKGILQILWYAWLVKQHPDYQTYPTVTPHLLRTLSIFEPTVETKIFLQLTPNQPYQPIEDITPFMPVIEKNIKKVLTAILDPTLPFVQTENQLVCQHCPYQRICERY